MNDKIALLLSGGIGDYIHYFIRLEDFFKMNGFDKSEVDIYVESTCPSNVSSLFETCLPGYSVQYSPPSIHWTITNPLLIPICQHDLQNRPAYLWVKQRGYEHIEDWFLPLYCQDYKANNSFFFDLLQAAWSNNLVISLRDKGFIWWPSKSVIHYIKQQVGNTYNIKFVGSANERKDWVAENFLIAADAKEAIQLVLSARLFIGTDTGFATIREIYQLPNFYCISEYWLKNLMKPYYYWDAKMSMTSSSKFAFCEQELINLVDGFLLKDQVA